MIVQAVGLEGSDNPCVETVALEGLDPCVQAVGGVRSLCTGRLWDWRDQMIPV